MELEDLREPAMNVSRIFRLRSRLLAVYLEVDRGLVGVMSVLNLGILVGYLVPEALKDLVGVLVTPPSFSTANFDDHVGDLVHCLVTDFACEPFGR